MCFKEDSSVALGSPESSKFKCFERILGLVLVIVLKYIRPRCFKLSRADKTPDAGATPGYSECCDSAVTHQ